MKIRIKGPSVRLRLSKSEVGRIVHEGLVAEETPFLSGILKYALRKTATGTALTADISNGLITMYVPETLIEGWDINDLITISAQMPLTDGKTLHLLLEKDFQCIDTTTEDQSDNYINPAQNC